MHMKKCREFTSGFRIRSTQVGVCELLIFCEISEFGIFEVNF